MLSHPFVIRDIFSGKGDLTEIIAANLGDFRLFFIKRGTVTFSKPTIADGLAKGGDSNFGGGGAGMSGGLFVHQTHRNGQPISTWHN